MIREYDISYAVKEWLLNKEWFLVTFNPPGSQGTLTIPNPKKAAKYKGQTGSESPDIIAYKNNTLLVVESKPLFNAPDMQKLLALTQDKERLDLLLKIAEKVCNTRNIAWKKRPSLLVGKAHAQPTNPYPNIQTFIVKTKAGWNPSSINPSQDPGTFMEVKLHPTSAEMQTLIESTVS